MEAYFLDSSALFKRYLLDPDRPIRCLYLVRDHPVVKAVLAGEPIPEATRRESFARKLSDWKPIKIPDPPLSDQIIRDRDDRY